jgi:MFS family permease
MGQGGEKGGLQRASHLRFAFFSFFTFPLAIIPLLYFLVRERGLSRGDYATLQSVYYFAMVALELPTGWLADRIGRKIPLILGPVFFSAGFFLMFVATDYQTFAIAEILQGAGHALLSGTPSALLYDTLLAEGRREEYLRLESSMSMWRTLGTALSFMAGGIIGAVFGLPAVALATSLFCLFGAGAAFGLREAPRELSSSRLEIPGFPSGGNLLTRVFAVFRNPQVRWLFTLYILLFFLLRFGFHTNQPWLEEAKKNGPLFVGGLYFSFALVALPFTKLAPSFSHRFGEVRTLLWLPVLMALSFLGLSIETSTLLIPLFFLQQVSFGLHWPLVQSYANHRIPSRDRALALSILSFGARLVFALGFPLVFSDGRSIQGIFFWVAVGALFLCLLGWFQAPGKQDELLFVGKEP